VGPGTVGRAPAGFRGQPHLGHGRRGRADCRPTEGRHTTVSAVTPHPVSSVVGGRPHVDESSRLRPEYPVLRT